MNKAITNTIVFDDVLDGLKEGIGWARGEQDPRVTRIEAPDLPPTYAPEQIRSKRTNSGMSQGLFSKYLSVSHKTLQSWEQGSRRPSPMSMRFLQLIELEPVLLNRVLAAQ